jgi:hypothetical protein
MDVGRTSSNKMKDVRINTNAREQCNAKKKGERKKSSVQKFKLIEYWQELYEEKVN